MKVLGEEGWVRAAPAVFGEEENRGVLLSPISKSLYCPSARTAQHLGAVAEEDLHLIGRKDFLHDAAAELGMIDNIADGEGLVHGVGAGGSGGHVHGALPILLHVLSGLLRFGGGPGHGGGRCGGRRRRGGGLEGIHGLLTGLTGLYAANGRLSLRFLGSRRRVILMHASAGAAFHLDNFPADKGDDDMPGNVIAASATGFNTISGTRQTSHKNSFKTRYHEKE